MIHIFGLIEGRDFRPIVTKKDKKFNLKKKLEKRGTARHPIAAD